MEERTYTTEQVAKRYHVTAQAVWKWVKAGRLIALRPGGGRTGPMIFRRQDLEAFERDCMTRRTVS